jgi:peptidoglycan/xylan/chitin deacetylase (PgdA/CDA1 family)
MLACVEGSLAMIHGKRAMLARLLDLSGFTGLTLAIRRQFPPTRLVVVNYHRVARPWENEEFDEDVCDASPESLSAQIGLLRREFTLIRLADLFEHLHGTPLPPNPALLTFDDGYRDNYEQALPILQRHGASAVFFVTTDYISRRRLFWWDRISYTLKHSRRPRFAINYPSYFEIDVSGGVSEPARRLHRLAAGAPALDFDRFLSELGTAAGIPWSDEIERELADRVLMTWDQVRGLQRAGMEVASHTRRHRVLTTLRDEDLVDELAGAKAELETVLGTSVKAVSYPVGRSIAHVPRIRAAVVAAGYEVGFSYASGIQRLPCVDPFDIRRISVERTWSRSRFRAALTFTWLG